MQSHPDIRGVSILITLVGHNWGITHVMEQMGVLIEAWFVCGILAKTLVTTKTTKLQILLWNVSITQSKIFSPCQLWIIMPTCQHIIFRWEVEWDLIILLITFLQGNHNWWRQFVVVVVFIIQHLFQSFAHDWLDDGVQLVNKLIDCLENVWIHKMIPFSYYLTFAMVCHDCALNQSQLFHVQESKDHQVWLNRVTIRLHKGDFVFSDAGIFWKQNM